MDISFTLKRLVIHSECSEKMRKNLHPAEYLFNSQVEKGFFGTNITVETIVGEMVLASRHCWN